MHEILERLGAEALVLDLGSRQGSFARERTAARVVRLDRELPGRGAELSVCGDARRLPFARGSVDAIVANHSLEHFDELGECLAEMGRVMDGRGALYVAVPDASTLTDRLYRWLGNGGGHVNAFVDPGALARQIEAATGLRHVATRTLCSSLSFLHRENAPRPLPRRMALLGGGYAWTLHLYVWLSRRVDRMLGTRTSVYGWAFYFGSVEGPIDEAVSRNVCIRCGSGTRARELAFQRWWRWFRWYACPCCGAANVFSDDGP